MKVDFSKRLRYRIAFVDETPPRARHRGVMRVEVWVNAAAPGEPSGPPPGTPGGHPPATPADPVGFTFLLPATRTPAIAGYGGIDADKTVHYMVK